LTALLAIGYKQKTRCTYEEPESSNINRWHDLSVVLMETLEPVF
jgi:hypothetical protein